MIKKKSRKLMYYWSHSTKSSKIPSPQSISVFFKTLKTNTAGKQNLLRM